MGREISFSHCILCVVGLSRSLTQCLLGVLCPGLRRAERTTAHRHIMASVRVCVDLYLHPSVLLDDVVLKNGENYCYVFIFSDFHLCRYVKVK